MDKANNSAITDIARLAKSIRVEDWSADTYSVIRLPKYAFVTDVWALVQTGFSTSDIYIGWTGNNETAVTNGFITSAALDATVTGLKRAIHDTAVTFPGKWFNAAGGGVTVTFGTTATAGKMYIFCQYFLVI